MGSIPANYTDYQDFDALFHNTEVMISNGINIMIEALELSAIKNISRYLSCALKDGNDLEARETYCIWKYNSRNNNTVDKYNY